MDKERILTEIRRALEPVYGERLKGVVLYGSVARGEDTEDSDIDVLVLLDKVEDYWVEREKAVEVLYPLSLEWDHPISAKPTSVNEYDKADYPLYRSAKREGVRL